MSILTWSPVECLEEQVPFVVGMCQLPSACDLVDRGGPRFAVILLGHKSGQ